jgi:signal transduction histidine kinase/CheY-like chemotaxis protein
MSARLDVLLLEDSVLDAELLVLELRRAGFDPTWQRVDDREAYLRALATDPDIVLADYSLPQLTALDALQLLRESGRDIPVIVVSGAMSEESCVEALRHGAVDYLLKDRLTRLGPAVQHALEQQRLVRERARAQLASSRHQQRFRAAFDNAPLGMAVTTHDGDVLDANPALLAMVGGPGTPSGTAPGTPSQVDLPIPDLRGCRLTTVVAEEDHGLVETYLRGLVAQEAPAAGLEIRLRGADGEVTWTHYSASLIQDQVPGAGRVVHQFLDITARRRAEQELVRQAEELTRFNAELQELDRLKSTFVATVSHELRTPLSNICGYTELLTEAGAAELGPEQRRMVEVVDRNAGRLLALIEDLLTFARAEAGTLTPTRAPVDLHELVGQVVRDLACSAGTAHVTLDSRLAPGPLVVLADGLQVERVLANLVSNAVKFTAPGGSAVIATEVDDAAVTVSVTDDGPGIAEEEQGKLFQRFYRADDAYARQIPGTGLGLSIARAIVEAHGGTIGLRSRPGAGTTVAFTLPR